MLHNFHEKYNNIILDPLTEDLIEEMRVLRNKNRECFVFSKIITREEQKAWFNSYLNIAGDYLFAIKNAYNNEFVGAASLYNIKDNEAEFGRLMVDKEKMKEKGVGYDAVKCACKIGFEQLKLHRIILEVFETNIPAYRTYDKIGFKAFNSENVLNKNIIYMELNKSQYDNLLA